MNDKEKLKLITDLIESDPSYGVINIPKEVREDE